MKHSNGEEVGLGDRVQLGEDTGGIVVCSLDTDEYTDQYPRSQWEYLKRGVLVKFPMYGLIHYEIDDPDLKFIGRIGAPK